MLHNSYYDINWFYDYNATEVLSQFNNIKSSKSILKLNQLANYGRKFIALSKIGSQQFPKALKNTLKISIIITIYILFFLFKSAYK